nr:group 1 truncated hemoglobin [uncultured Methylophaga sp.]
MSKHNQASLYEKLGGEEGVAVIVNNLTINIGHDQQIFHYFAEANVTRFKKNLTQHLCAISDGPCQYEGDSMEQIHHGMDINERDFNHLVDLLIDAMDEAGISHPTQNLLLARLAPLRQQIIYR